MQGSRSGRDYLKGSRQEEKCPEPRDGPLGFLEHSFAHTGTERGVEALKLFSSPQKPAAPQVA